MTAYETERALVQFAEQIIKTFGKEIGIQDLIQKSANPLIKGKEYISLFKHWAKVNNGTLDKTGKKFIYRAVDDMLFYNSRTPRCSYGIGFVSTEALEDLEDGKLYSYYDLVGEEEE